MPRQTGAILLYALAALLLLGALAAALLGLTGTVATQAVHNNQGAQARYAASSALSYARALTAAQLDAIHGATGQSQTLTITDACRFTLTVAAPSAGSYAVSALGTAAPGTPLETNCRLTATVTPPAATNTAVAVNSGTNVALEQYATVNGDVSGKAVHLQNQATVNGNVAAETGITLEQGDLVTGTACTTSGDVHLQTGARINGNVAVHGNLTLEADAQIAADVSVTGTLTLKTGARIGGTAYVKAGAAGVTNTGGTIAGGIEPLTSAVTCALAAVPAPPVASGTAPALTLESGKTQTLAHGSYTYESITLKNGSTLYLDLSAGLPITLTVTGDVNLEDGSSLQIKTRTSGGYKSIRDLYAAGEIESASLVYLKAEGTVTLKYKQAWYGTLFARTALAFEQNVVLIGAYASPGPVSLKTSVSLLAYVLADTAW